MTDNTDVAACCSSSDNSNNADASQDSQSQLSLQEIIARNKEKAMQLRAAKRSLQQEPSMLVWLLTRLYV